MSDTNGKPIRAAFLLRMSTDQQKDSPARQRANVKPACEANNLEIVKEYSDLGISGLKTSKRAGLRDMLKDAKAGEFEVLVVDSIDRLSRLDSVDVGEIIKPLRQAGVKLFSASEGWRDLSKFTDRLSFMMSTEMSNQFSSSLAYKTLTGRINKIKNRKIAARRCYGYDRVIRDETGKEMARVKWSEAFAKPKNWTSHLEPTTDAEVLATVRWMFQFYAETDESLNSVTKSLNERKVPSPQGTTWRVNAVRKVLENPTFIGVARFGMEKTGSFYQISATGEIEDGNGDAESGSRIYDYDSPGIVIEGAHEPIIDSETFAKVQERLKKRKTYGVRRGQRSRSYPLSGILRCGSCGGSLSGHTATVRDHRDGERRLIRYYTCNRGAQHSCVQWSLRAEECEQAITNYAVEFLESQIELLKAAVDKEISGRRKKSPAKDNHLREELERLNKRIDNGVENILDADKELIPELSEKLQQWKNRRDEIQNELDHQPKPRDIKLEASLVIAKFEGLSTKIKAASPTDAREFYCQVFDHIDIFWDDQAPRGRKFDKGVVFFG